MKVEEVSTTEDSDQASRVRQAFLDQAGYCDRLQSPFTALLCRALGEGLDPSNEIERYILDWHGDPSPFGDSVPLRVAGALHYLVRAGRSSDLAAVYPPHAIPGPRALLSGARAALLEQDLFVREFMRSPPQTNEVGRSAALIAGWLEIARVTRLPLSLFEIGSSAGLNLIADRYAYRFGDMHWAADHDGLGLRHIPRAALTINCEWTGRRPAVEAPLLIQSRRGCDRNPLDTTDPTHRERLIAYVWADQAERLERLETAIRTMLENPLSVERADAAAWIQMAISTGSERGVARVIFHSFVWSYRDLASQQVIANHLGRIGAMASTDAPLAWLRLELVGKNQPAALRLTLWPAGEDNLLALVHPHGRWVRWCC